jgi:GNAT superfamily N-acetyltransferase
MVIPSALSSRITPSTSPTSSGSTVDLHPVEHSPDGRDHPRLARAGRYRTDLRAFETADGRGLVVVGRGLAHRWELAFEVAPSARGRGLGRALVTAGRTLAPAGEPVFVQVAPGNVPSLRAVFAAGDFTPIGGEILFAPRE